MTFIHSSGLHALLNVQRELLAQGRHLRLLNLWGPPRKVFELVGLDDLVADGSQQLEDAS